MGYGGHDGRWAVMAEEEGAMMAIEQIPAEMSVELRGGGKVDLGL